MFVGVFGKTICARMLLFLLAFPCSPAWIFPVASINIYPAARSPIRLKAGEEKWTLGRCKWTNFISPQLLVSIWRNLRFSLHNATYSVYELLHPAQPLERALAVYIWYFDTKRDVQSARRMNYSDVLGERRMGNETVQKRANNIKYTDENGIHFDSETWADSNCLWIF